MSEFDQPKDENNIDNIIDVADATFTTNLSDMPGSSDIDDGDGDDEGIFAPATNVKPAKSSGMLTGVVTVLAVIGGGGYVYFNHPDMVQQALQNVGVSAEIVDKAKDVAASVAPVDNNANMTPATTEVADAGVMTTPTPPPVEQAAAPVPADAPTPAVVPDVATTPDASTAPVVAPEQKVADTAATPVANGDGNVKDPMPIQADAPANNSVAEKKADAVDTPAAMPAPTETAATAAPAPVPSDAAPVSKDVPTNLTQGQFVPIDLTKPETKDVGKGSDKVIDTATIAPVKAAEPTATSSAPVATASKKEVKDSKDVKKDVKAADAVKKDDPVNNTKGAPVTTTADAAKPVEKSTDKPADKPAVQTVGDADMPKSDLITPTTKVAVPSDKGNASIDAALSDKPIKNPDGTVTPPKTVFFDSPDGKMIKDIPAPSMNPAKGNGESIIIVKDSGALATVNNKHMKTSQPKNVSFSSTDLDPKIVAATRAMKLERYDAAEQMYNDLYKMNQRDGRILMGRALLFQKTGRPHEAVTAYEELLRVNPDNPDAVVNLAGLIRKEYPAMALNKLLDLKQQYPDNVAVLAQLGITYADSGNFEDAFTSLSHAASLDPNNPQHYYNMAVISERAHDVPRAISNYEKALEIDAVYGTGRQVSREKIYDRLSVLRGH